MSLKEHFITTDGGLRDVPIQPVAFPGLENLQLQAIINQLDDLQSAIEAPHLCSLTVDDYSSQRGTVVYSNQLNAFPRAHSQSLRYLRFSTNSKFFTSEGLVSLVSVAPLFTELEYLLDIDKSADSSANAPNGRGFARMSTPVNATLRYVLAQC